MLSRVYFQQLSNNHTTFPLKFIVREPLHIRYCEISCAQKSAILKLTEVLHIGIWMRLIIMVRQTLMTKWMQKEVNYSSSLSGILYPISSLQPYLLPPQIGWGLDAEAIHYKNVQDHGESKVYHPSSQTTSQIEINGWEMPSKAFNNFAKEPFSWEKEDVFYHVFLT